MKRLPVWLSAPLVLVIFCAGSSFSGCSKPKQDQELRVVFGSEVLTLDPHEMFETVTDSYAMNVFEPLIRFDWQASFVPVLATRWEIADGKTWRFNIRSGVSFHDGSPLGPEDVVFSIRRILDNAGSELHPYLKSIEDVRVSGPDSVEIVCNKPAGLLSVLSFAYVLPKKLLETQGAAKFFENPVGSGPYRFAGWKPKEFVRFERFDGHWMEKPRFKKAEFLFRYGDDAGWAATIEKGPSILVGPSFSSWLERKGEKGLVLSSRPGLSVHFLVPKLSPPSPFADLKVRQALRSALDYSRFSENSPFGPLLPASQFVSPGIVGFNPQITVPVHDPERARKLLAEAGYPNGLKVKVTFLSSSEAIFRELAQQLAPSGIVFEADPADSTVLYDRMARCQTDMAVFGWICSTGDGGELLDGTFSHWSPEPASNAPCGYQNARLDELSQSASMALDPIERTAVLQQAMTLLTEELPWIPLFIPQDRYALSEELEWEPRPDAEVYIPAVGLKSSKKSRK